MTALPLPDPDPVPEAAVEVDAHSPPRLPTPR